VSWYYTWSIECFATILTFLIDRQTTNSPAGTFKQVSAVAGEPRDTVRYV